MSCLVIYISLLVIIDLVLQISVRLLTFLFAFIETFIFVFSADVLILFTVVRLNVCYRYRPYCVSALELSILPVLLPFIILSFIPLFQCLSLQSTCYFFT